MISNKESTFLQYPFTKLNSGLNLLVIAISVIFIGVVIMIAIIVKCRSKGIKKKNSICEEDGYNFDSGILKPNIVNENSDSGDDILYKKDRRFVVRRVQPKRSSLRSQTSVSSISSVDSESGGVPSIVVLLATESNSASVTLIRAKHLRRGGGSSTDKPIPEKVLARIYPMSRSMSTDSSQSDNEQRTRKGIDFFETGFVKSKKSKCIKFNEKETFRMSADCFPVRISIYEMDKQMIRYNIGNCFLRINTRDNYQTNQLIKLSLHPTVIKAKNSTY